jgi:hypothetical protein
MAAEKPIIFQPHMVESILRGLKTQTRRVIKFPAHSYQPDTAWIASVNPDGTDGWIAWGPKPATDDFSRRAYPNGGGFPCPYGCAGGFLWIRERWRVELVYDHLKPSELKDDTHIYYGYRQNLKAGRIRSPLHMPRFASRLTVRIVSIKPERLQDITEHGARDEAFLNREHFRENWDNINAKRGFGWETNPWVWVITFEEKT